MLALLSPWMSMNASDDDDDATGSLAEPGEIEEEVATDGEVFDPYEECFESFPHFYLPGIDLEMDGPEEFRAGLEESRRKAPRQRKLARSMVANLAPGMVFEHTRDLPDLFATPATPGHSH